jgi:hypothetical protein
MDSIRSSIHSIGMATGTFTPWRGFPSEESIYRAARAFRVGR